MSVLFVLIPLLPLLACLVLAVSGRRIGEASHRIAIPAVAASFALSLVAFVDVLRDGPRTIELYRLLQTGTLVVDFGLFVDQLAVLLLLLVTGVSAIVQVYSSRYMIGDPRYQRFFAVVALFTSAMVALVMSRNLLLTYMCWEAMGICSYLLISHWAQRPAAGRAAMKAFLVNAVADLGLGCAVLLTFQVYGTLDIPTILDRAGRAAGETVNVLGWTGLEWAVPATTVIPLLLFVAAMGKSAQVPLHVWLPFAMEAPTPVSALIHAATMVNAGPFLLVRFSPMLVLAPFAMTVIAIVGATTAIFAALVALTQTDIKKILAYSTMSHIGFMVMTCGVGAFAAAVFHLLAHGFLKAFLFLSAGNSLQSTAAHPGHAAHAAADTAASFRPLAWGALLLACIPPAILFSGPYEALWTLHGALAAQWTFWAVALATVFFTALYLFRLIHRLFSESFSLADATVRPRLFAPPHSLIVLAGALVVAGFFYGFPSWFAGFIAPALAQASQAGPSAAAAAGLPGGPLLPLLAAVSGWAFAVTLRRRPLLAAEGWRSTLYVWFWNKLYFDEVYDAVVVRSTLRLAGGLAHWIERGVVDRSLQLVVSASAHTALWLWRVLEGRGLDQAVGSTATASMIAARWLWRVLEGRGIQGSVDRLSHQADAVGRFLQTRELHTLQEHLLLVVGGLAGLLVLFYLVIHGASMTELLAAHLISILIAVPFATILVLALIRHESVIRALALVGTALNLALALFLWWRFDPADRGMQFVERIQWMPTFNINYAVGVDGMSVLLVVLTALLSPICVLCSWKSIDTHVKAFMSLVLLVEGAMIAVFAALDVFLFFMFWEITMVPMYFMIILWGGPGRIAAGIKFVLYSLTGSLLLLVGILALYVLGGRTFDLLQLSAQRLDPAVQMWIFAAFLLAFAIKLPMIPFHSWLPDAHSEAPTAGSVILAGVLLKMGGYGFLRLGLPILPDAAVAYAPVISWFSIAAILYGGYLALAQTDLKRLVAYSSISHMGFVTLGIFSFRDQGIQGAMLQMFNHGITTGALFLAVGQLYDRTHSRSIADYGGLHEPMPRFAAFLCLFSVASFGLPGTSNFIGEFLVLVGTSYESFAKVLLAMGGIVLAAAYMLWMLQRVILGQATSRAVSLLPDLDARETAVLVPLAVLVFAIGLYPGPLMSLMDGSVTRLVEQMQNVNLTRLP